ncbi:putative short-chain dehydrogenase [Thozetella sp. PMI_491]|nr:putative short-chain dehydrogenase [Thozetella sp. PMI_491]
MEATMSDQFAPYAKLFVKRSGPGDARPTALQVIQDNDLVNKWTGRVVLITGATSGLGIETARALYATGADIYITARDLKKGQGVVEDIVKSSEGKGKIDLIEMDMTSLESVKKAAKSFLAKSNKLNILINNAGIMAVPELRRTAAGFEQQFGVNHLAHYTLAVSLLPALIQSSSPSFNSRVISVTSAGHGFSSVRFDDTYLSANYDPWVAYGQSKTANIWLANYIDRVYGPQGVHANSVHPGLIMTPLLQHMPQEQRQQYANDEYMMAQVKSPEQGAATATWAAVASVWEGNGGRFLVDCGIGKPAVNAQEMADEGFAPHAFDVEGENRLWDLSATLTGVQGEA